MTFLDYLRNQRTSTNAVWQQFVLAYKTKSKDIYVFFEGKEDKCFYLPEIKRLYAKKGNVTCYICDGKAGVIETYIKIKEKVNNKRRILFFIDKDHDDLIGKIGIKPPKSNSFYQTEYYSIENYIVCHDVIRSVWSYIWLLDENDAGLKDLCDLFDEYQERYQKKCHRLMAWVIHHRLKGTRPNLGDLNLSKIFNLSDSYDVIPNKNLIQILDKLCQVRTDILAWRSILRIARSLKGENPKTFLRGKFDLWFFVNFLNLTLKKLRSSFPTGPKKPTSRTNITYNNAIEILSKYMKLPKSFYDFLEYNFSRI